MAILVMEFQSGDTILERFLPKNQHNHRKLLNSSGERSKIGHRFSNKVILKNINKKKCAPKFLFLLMKKNEKDSDDF